MSIEAVTFDLDGTIYSSSAIRLPFVLRNFFRMRVVRVIRRVREDMRHQVFDDGAAFFAAQHREVARRLEISEDEAEAAFVDLFSTRLCAVLARVGPFNDVRPSVMRIVEAGLKVGVVSDYAVEDKLAALGLSDLPWSVLVAADAEGALKPHPRAFQRAAERLGLPPRAVLHVGDREDTDVHGAEAAGSRALLYDPMAGPVVSLLDAARAAIRLRGEGGIDARGLPSR